MRYLELNAHRAGTDDGGRQSDDGGGREWPHGAAFRAAALAAGVVLWGCLLMGQTVVGRIAGVITDPSGAAVPGAEVVLTEIGTGAKRSTVSMGSGAYVLESVPAGRYSLEVRKQDFETYVLGNLVLDVNQSRSVDIQLSVGATTQTVQVEATTLGLDTTTATQSQVIGHQDIVEMPLNGRNFTELIQLAPGASPIETGQQSSYTITGGVSPAVNGMRAQMNDFTLDGVDNNMRFSNTYAQSPPPDALAEFSLQSNQTSPEASFAAGATVNLVTRPGENQFHGALWEFLRNDAFDANGYFNNFYGEPRVPYRQNQFGFFVGGPVLVPHILNGRKSRTYFAGYYEGFRVRQTNTTTAVVPTQAERSGDFSQSLGPAIATDCLGRPILQGELYNPFTTVAHASCPEGYVRDPFPNNTIPSSLIDANANAYVQDLYPLPNRSSLPNFALPQETVQNNWQWGTRIDHTFSERDTLFGRVSQYNANLVTPGALPVNALERINSGVNVAIHETHIISPVFLLDSTFGYNRATIANQSILPGAAFLGSINPQLTINTAAGLLPASQTFLGSALTGVSFQYAPVAFPDYSYQYNLDFKKISGAHDMGFGFRLMHYRHWVPLGGAVAFGYSPFTTGFPANTSTGDPLASFLLGLPNGVNPQREPGLTSFGDVYIGYWGDVWRLRPNLTIDYGLQYVYGTPPLVNGNKIADFDFAEALTQPDATNFAFAYLWAATNPATGAPPNAPRKSLVAPDRADFAPRFAVAYSPFKNTVIRSGFGTYYDYNTNLEQNSVRVLETNYPFVLNQTATAINQLVPGPITLKNPYPSPSTVASTGHSIDLNLKTPYGLEWNLGIEQLLPAGMKLSVGYVGSVGRRLIVTTEGNLAQIGSGSIPSRRPLHSGAGFPDAQGFGISSYNALQAKLEKSASHGLTFLNSYTWSKSLDETSDANLIEIEYTYKPSLSYGPSDYNIGQMNTSLFVYELPFGRGRRFGSAISKPVNGLVGGWESSGIITFRSGIPFTVISGVDSANIGGQNEYAQIVSPAKPAGFTPSRSAWFNPKAFQIPAFGALGNSSRNAFQGPSSHNVDFALMKNFPLGERARLQFRSEFFNAFNWVQFGTPNANVSSGPLFGQILSAGAPREIQFALKLLW